MAKSARKYQKPVRKKAFMSKKEIIITSVVVAAIIAIVILLISIANQDDFIRVKDGALVMEDNWIIANYSKTGSANYYKIGTLGEIEGYSLDASSAKLPTKRLDPTGEETDIEYILVGSSAKDYAEMADYAADFVSEQYSVEVSQPSDITLNGRAAKYITYSTPGDDPDDETDGVFVVVCYVDYTGDHCVFIQLNAKSEIGAPEYLEAVANQITLEERE